MAFCRHCGAQLPDGATFCPVCGTETSRQNNSGADWRFDQASDAAANRGICILCYLGPLFLIPYFTRRASPFVSFHSNQGLVLLLFELIGGIALHVPFLGWLIGAFCGIFAFICFVLGIINVSNGEMKPLPLIGGISILNEN